MKKLMGAVLAVLLLFLMLGSPSVARADDEPAPDPVATETATPASEPSEEPADEAKDEAVTKARTQPQPDEKKVGVCKYSGTPGVDEKFSSYNKVSKNTLKNWDGTFPFPFPDAHGKSVAIGWASEVSQSDCPKAEGFKPYEVTREWIVPKTAGNPKTKPVDKTFFPQPKLVGELECGLWKQVDIYLIDSAKDEKILNSLGDVLEWKNGQPEDSAIYEDHEFIYGGDCYTPELPEPPALTVNPPTCEAPFNTFSITGQTKDIRFVRGDLRMRAEDIVAAQSAGMSVEEALALHGLTPEYGVPLTFEVIWYDRTEGHKGDHKIGEVTVTLTDPASLVCEPKVEKTEWVDGEWVCGDTTVVQTRTVTTTPYKAIVVDGKYVLVLDTENATSKEETQVRDLTPEEQQSVCDVPETPEPLVEYGEWGGDTPTCEVPEVVWTRTVTTTTYRWEWVGFGEENTNGYTLVTAVSTDTEEDTVFLDERVDCSPEPTPEPSKPVRTPPSLAFTGSDMDGIGLGAVLALVGGALIGLARVRRRH